MKLYHGTTRNRIVKILKEGLKPRVERKSSCFDLDGKRVRAVGFTEEFRIASAFACRKSYMYSGLPVVLKIEYPRSKLLTLIEKESGHIGKVSKKRIPGKYITGFNTVKLISLKKTAKILKLKIEARGYVSAK